MHPRMMAMWRRAGGHACGCDRPARRSSWGSCREHRHYAEEGASFGVRRPLRFLAYRLALDEPQVTALATVIGDLKTERAQAAVDDRRALAALAEAVSAEPFDAARAGEAAALRSKSAEQVQAAVVRGLERMHALLTPEQRTKLAYLLRTGALQM
ncbi:MAG: Spy/CpxP family protein refolding chaperone [Candidatus Eiseniibacteriota bacterium]